MQLRALAALAVLSLLSSPAVACGIALNTSGTLAPASDYSRLGSDELGGVAASFIVSNALFGGNFRVTVDAPTLVSSPAGFNTGSAQTAAAYTGVGLLNYVSQSYTTGSSHFDVSGLLGALSVVVTLNNRITNSSGFAAGTYQTRTVVTCS